VIAVAGGISDPAKLQAFCRSPAADISCKAAPPAPEMRERRQARLDSDPEFRQRYGKAGESYRDQRIRAVFAMAPGLVPMFTPESLGAISIPVAIVSGDADEVVSSVSHAEALASAIPHATLKLFPRAGHFVFFDTCTAVGRLVLRTVCVDADGVDRDAIHAETVGRALDFFTANLR
jgi:predicted dienelactone hydrolase